jgi:hypothetical protein
MSKFLRFNDLRERGIVANRVTLGAWIASEGFPTGILAGPNTRLWPEEQINEWLASRPTGPKTDLRKQEVEHAS